MADLTRAFALIDAERKRQIEAEGYTAEHDEEHSVAALYHAGIAYEFGDPQWWPWEQVGFKPKDALSDLIRAGALYQAASDLSGDTQRGSLQQRVAEKLTALLTHPVVADLLAEARADEQRKMRVWLDKHAEELVREAFARADREATR